MRPIFAVLGTCGAPALVLSLGMPAAAQSSNDLLPDLMVVADALAQSRIDTDSLPTRRLLRLSAATPNIGRGPLEIRGSTVLSPAQREVLQRVYASDGTFWDRPAGTSTYHPNHAHIHFDDWAVYRLRARTAGGLPGDVVARGNKTSFCLSDLQVYDPAVTGGAPGRYLTCGQTVQGISPGWSDVYDLELPDQWIDITDVPDGSYWLEAEVDPDDRILESDEGNNLARMAIALGPAPVALPDAFEPNDFPAEVLQHAQGAADSPRLGLLTRRIVLDGLSLEDDADYFEFELDQTGLPGAYLRIDSAYLGSDLDLYLFDADDNFIQASDLVGNSEQVSLAALPPGAYFALVIAYAGRNPGYRLTIDPLINQPPQLILQPGRGAVWVERAFEALPVEWDSRDPDADPTLVSLYIDRDQTRDKGTLPLGGYQQLAGEAGHAAVNTAGLDLGAWFLYAEATDGHGRSGSWAPDVFVLYLKGDLDGNATVDLEDWRLFTNQQRGCRRRSRPAIPGWQSIMDLDRDGDVDAWDTRLFAAEVFHPDASCSSTHTAERER